MGADSYLQFISVLIIFVVVLAATYYATKWIANYQKGTESGKNIEIIETCRISNNKYIQIVRVGERYISLGVTNDQITNLGDVDPSEIVKEPKAQGNMSFNDILEKIKGEKKSSNGK